MLLSVQRSVSLHSCGLPTGVFNHGPARVRQSAQEHSACNTRFRRCIVRAGDARLKELPIFPLNVVAFPACQTPLNIFEARYRVLFNTLLSGEEGIDEELVQQDAKHVGSKQFGMCFVNKKGMCKVGTTLQISQHLRLDDGRLAINNQGVERFKVIKVLAERPVLMALVEVLQEEQDEGELFEELARDVRENFRTLLLLNARAKQREPTQVPDEIDTFRPGALSYYIASLLVESPLHQQVMLEEDSLQKRLEAQKELLVGSVAYVRARLALEGAFAAPAPEQEGTAAATPDTQIPLAELQQSNPDPAIRQEGETKPEEPKPKDDGEDGRSAKQ